jgi:ABC-type antimicrobial peptide transport system permease subunit
MMDLVSFRELYGYLTDDKKAEIAALKAQSTAKDVTRENAEAALFGSKDSGDSGSAGQSDSARNVTANATPGIDPDQALQGLAGRLQREEMASRVYDPKQLESGVVLNAAVILKDPKQLDQTMKEIEAVGKQKGLPLKAISWQAASGFIGQFVNMAQMVLSVAVLIIFVVALVIINNAMVMATLQRVQEIGTLRAVGAQRRFILWMLVIEAMVIGALFGALGAAVGAGIITWIGQVGIPAFSDIATFFFSGPALHPSLGATSLVVALVIVLFVSVLSSLYPAWLAMRISPRQAMQSED